ncbi:hypothetical protein DYB32_007427 [Aphanomyces invadans]|uniref:Phosphatidate phosphatase APP1 catalytic domain-containing protein n=1 Tax=Aphanomyces invadans TaxID=157072 RepID=A0A3R6WI45_9STRA|nr:hypothetical protein DYB32_007427 [Aphanomyces invadans]
MQQHLVSPWNRQKADFQKAAFNVLKGTYGSDLTLLKEDINSDFVPSLGGFKGGDLHQLIYGCRDLTQVVSVVQHIAVEALKVGSSSSQRPLIKIMSDIDDTLFAGLKLDNFVRYTTLFPEYKFVFFGDSGQGDALLASQMRALFPDKVCKRGLRGMPPNDDFMQVVATFIHDIDPASPLTGDGGLKADYSKNGVHFYNNYAAAGILAFEMGLISKEDATSVVQSCHDELDSMTFTGRDSTTKHAQRKEELNLEADRWSHAFRPTT